MDGQKMLLSGYYITTMGSGAFASEDLLDDFIENTEPQRFSVKCVSDSTTDSIYTTTTLIEKAIGDLDELSKLPVGWDSYGSPKISNDLIMAAKSFLYLLEFEFIAPRIVPISGGGIQLEWQIGERELELEFTNSENIGYLKVYNGEPIEESQFNRNDFNTGRNTIQWLKGS